MKNIFTSNIEKITVGTLLLIIGLMAGIFLSSPRHTQAPTVVDSQDTIPTVVGVDVSETSSTKDPICVGEFCDGSGESDDTSHLTILNIPLLISVPNDVTSCTQSVFFAPHAVPKTQGVLRATYEKLFSLAATSQVPTDAILNRVALEKNLFFDGVTLSDGLARVYLSGSIMAVGCQSEELRAQIYQAALPLETVNYVEVYLNQELYW